MRSEENLKAAQKSTINIKELFSGKMYWLNEHKVILLALIVLMTVLSILSPNFLTKGNLLDIVRVVSINGIMAVGMTMVLLTGGIDLSVGSVFALCGAIAASMMSGGYSDYVTSNIVKLPILIVIPLVVAVGALIGLINGIVVTKLKVEPFIATLAMMSFGRGLTYLYTGGYPINFKPMPADFKWLGQGYLAGIPAPTIFFIIFTLTGGYVLKYTSFGRSLFAIGGNRDAARLSGIKVNRNIRWAYMLIGILSSIAGIIMTSRVASASPIAGEGYEMDVIAGVVIGGTQMTGGRDSIFGTVIGVLIFGVIENGLNILGVPTYYKYIIKGTIIILAISYNSFVPGRKKVSLKVAERRTA